MNLFLRPVLSLVSLAFVASLISCKKDEEVSGPDRMVGSYSFEGRTIGGFGTLPVGTMTVTKIAGDKVRITVPSDSTNLPIYTVDYTVNDLKLTEITTDSFLIPHPYLSRIIHGGGKRVNFFRNSSGELSGSYLVIDGTFTTDQKNCPFAPNLVRYKFIGRKIK